MNRFRLFPRLLLITAFSLSSFSVIVPHSARADVPCAIAPFEQEFMANQGLPYAKVGGNLVRGKDTLLRLFLSVPACAPTGTLISVTGGSVQVLNGNTPLGDGSLFSPASPTAIAPSYVSGAVPKNHPGDPIFFIPGRFLTPCGGSTPCAKDEFVATFRIKVLYSVNGNNGLQKSFVETAPIGKKTNALRILAVPMGDVHQSFRSQFTPAGEAATRKAMQTLARIWPVPNSVGELCPAPKTAGLGCAPAQPGGIRYHIDLSTVLDLTDPTLLVPRKGTRNRFCVGQANFDVLRARLGQFLTTWNAHNPSNSADEVIGIADEAISTGGDDGCAEGMGALNSPQSWVRAISDTSTVRSMTGSLMAMELGHTLGLTPDPRGSHYHSNARQADDAAIDRGYNVDTRSFIPLDKTAMSLDNQDSPWSDDVTLYEPADQGFSLCDLGGPSTGAECTTPQLPLGTTQGVNAGPRIVVSGRTSAGAGPSPYDTSIFESYHTENIAETPPCDTCRYRVIESGVGPSQPIGFKVSFRNLAHRITNIPGAQNQFDLRPMGVFSFALHDGVAPTGFTIYYCGQPDPGPCIANPATLGEPLYGDEHHQTPPTVTQVSTVNAGVPYNFGNVSNDDFDSPDLSWNAQWLSFAYFEFGKQIRDYVYAVGSGSSGDGTVEFLDGYRMADTANGGPKGLQDTCVFPSANVQGLTEDSDAVGLWYTELGYFGYGGGSIHHVDQHNCQSTKGAAPDSFPLAAGIQGDIGALARDPDELAVWGAGYSPVYTRRGYKNAIYKISVNYGTRGNRLDSCVLGTSTYGNDSIAIAKIPGLTKPNGQPGSGTYILTDSGGVATPGNTLEVYDRADCTGGLQAPLIKTYPKVVGMSGLDWVANPSGSGGTLYATNGNSIYDLGGAPFQTVGNTIPVSFGTARGITVAHSAYKIKVAPVGDANAGSLATGVAGENTAAVFCPSNTMVFRSDGDIYAEPVTFTTPPMFGAPVRIWDASDQTPAALELTCTQNEEVIFQAKGNDHGNLVNDLYMIDLNGKRLGKITSGTSPTGYISYAPSASRTPGDDRLAFAWGSNIYTMDYHAVINRIPTGTTDPVSLSKLVVQNADSPAWGTDGRIAYSETGTDFPGIDSVASDGSGETRLIDYTWSGRSPSMSGTVLAFAGGDGPPNGTLGIQLVNLAQTSATVHVYGDDPEGMTADLVYQCARGGAIEPVDVGRRPVSAWGNSAQFHSTYDVSNACGDGGRPGTLTAIVSNGFDQSVIDIDSQAPVPSAPKPPVAAIHSPIIGAHFGPHSTIPLNGSGVDAENGELGPPIQSEDASPDASPVGSIEWWMDDTLPGSLGTDRNVDAVPPLGGWRPGIHTIHLRATDADGNAVATTQSITIADEDPPTVSIENDNIWRNVDVTIPLHAVDPGSGLSSFACLLDGVSKAITPALTPNSFIYDGTISVTTSGAHQLKCSVRDGAGNLGEASSTILVDKVAPSISLPAPVTSWTKNSPVSLHLAAGDALSHLTSLQCTIDGVAATPQPAPVSDAATYSGDVNVVGDGEHAILCTATDAARNVSSASTSLRVDASAPGLQVTTSAPAGGWSLTSPATVSIHAADATSKLSQITCKNSGVVVTPSPGLVPGAASYDATFTVPGEGIHTVTCTAADVAGNATTTTLSVKIDLAAPSIALATTGIWNKSSPVNIHITASDTGSGIASISCKVDGTPTSIAPAVVSGAATYGGDVSVFNEGNHAIACVVNDISGRASGVTGSVLIDVTPPSVQINLPSTVNGWVPSDPAPVGVRAADARSKLSTLSCKVDGANATISPVLTAGSATHDSSFTVSGQGSHQLTCTATDIAGNTMTTPSSMKIDSVGPTLSLSVPATPHGWSRSSPVLVGVTAADAGSKLATLACTVDGNAVALRPDLIVGSASYSGTVSIDGEGAHPVSCISIDAAGNQRTKTASVGIDRTAPAIAITTPSAGAIYTLNQNVPAAFACNDALSGVETCIGSAGAGAPIDTSTPGLHSFRVDATDNAGNGAPPVMVSYRVAYNFGWSAPTKAPDETNSPSVVGSTNVAFKLTDAQGNAIVDLAAITGVTWRLEPLGLVGNWSLGLLEQPASGTLAVSGDHFVYSWNVPPIPLPMVISVKLRDGQPPHQAYFRLIP